MVVRRESGLVSSNTHTRMHARSIWWSDKQASDCHLLVEGLLQTRLRKDRQCALQPSGKSPHPFAALAVIASLGTSPVLARGGGGGGGHFGGGGTFEGSGEWFSRRRIWWARFSSGRKNVWRRIQSSPLLWRLQRLCGIEPVQSVAKSIFLVALYVLKARRGDSLPATEARPQAARKSGRGRPTCLRVVGRLSQSKKTAQDVRSAGLVEGFRACHPRSPVSKAR